MMEQVVAADRAANLRPPEERWIVQAMDFSALSQPESDPQTDAEQYWRVPEKRLRGKAKCVVVGPARTAELGKLNAPVLCGRETVRPIVVSASGSKARHKVDGIVEYAAPGNIYFAQKMSEVAVAAAQQTLLCHDYSPEQKLYEADLRDEIVRQLAPKWGQPTMKMTVPYCEEWARGTRDCTLMLVGSIGWFELVKSRLPACGLVLLADGLSSHAAASHFLNNVEEEIPEVYGFCPPDTAPKNHWFWGAAAFLAVQQALAGHAVELNDFTYGRLKLSGDAQLASPVLCR
ncbi:MAG: hypothetical protein U0271_35285 [Polyangiaceae bacterium]